MAIGRWTNTLVLVTLVLASSMLVRSDAPPAPLPLHIVYLGRISPAEDRSYRRLTHELQRIQAPAGTKLQLTFIPALLAHSWRIEESVSEALAMRPDVIVAPSAATARTAVNRRSGVPIVFSSFQDPVRSGIVDALERRNAPVTGVWVADDLDEKRLELLRDAYPKARTVAVLMDRSWARDRDSEQRLSSQARRLGLSLTMLFADNGEEAESMLATYGGTEFDVWCLPPTGLAYLHTRDILARLLAWRRPVITGEAVDVQHGAVMAYGVDESFRWPALADLVQRVANGEPPGQIPIQRPQRYLLAVRAAPDAGLPAPVLAVQRQADILVR